MKEMREKVQSANMIRNNWHRAKVLLLKYLVNKESMLTGKTLVSSKNKITEI